jgi:hypothetical protein
MAMSEFPRTCVFIQERILTQAATRFQLTASFFCGDFNRRADGLYCRVCGSIRFGRTPNLEAVRVDQNGVTGTFSTTRMRMRLHFGQRPKT